MRHNPMLYCININNSLYLEAIEKSGIPYVHIHAPVEPGTVQEAGTSTMIFGIDTLEDPRFAPIIGTAPEQAHKICISGEQTTPVKCALLKQGIADYLTAPEPHRLIQVIRASLTATTASSGEILILDSDAKHRSVLSSIIGRFGFSPVFIKNVAMLIENGCGQTLAFIAVNLGEPGLDLKGLVRGYQAHPQLKRIPLLAYHDQDRGIFIHEILGGLNRITSYILSMEEMYAFLADILYRKEVTPLIEKLHTLMITGEIDFSSETLGRIYHDHRDRLFRLKSIYDDATARTCENLADAIRLSMIKIEGLRWLTVGQGSIKTITCGAGALI